MGIGVLGRVFEEKDWIELKAIFDRLNQLMVLMKFTLMMNQSLANLRRITNRGIGGGRRPTAASVESGRVCNLGMAESGGTGIGLNPALGCV